MLTDKIRLSGPESNDLEDILSSPLAVIFPDDITNQHGDRDNRVIYLSPPPSGPSPLLSQIRKGKIVRSCLATICGMLGCSLRSS
jgi:hypothetical protein